MAFTSLDTLRKMPRAQIPNAAELTGFSTAQAQAEDRVAALEKAMEKKRNAKTSAKRGGATLTQSEAKRLKAEGVRSTDSA